ncbi:hypothetical protein C6502_17435 [Candidatus Poribacteria bacterium]|nr:MAG: hypothetical protein C6502_17435 [Candidatus Poribacteria bacterium]
MNRHPLLDVEHIEQTPDVYLNAVGHVFAVFDERSQDSGNISYGVEIAQERYFVKTAGPPSDPNPFLNHAERVSLLRNAVQLRRSCNHCTLPPLHQVIESPTGPLLVYQWLDGELIRVEAAMRNDPGSTFQRFRRLPSHEIIRALDLVYELHHQLAQLGWIAVDFYDGCLIYDFDRQKLHIVDLDHYCKAPFLTYSANLKDWDSYPDLSGLRESERASFPIGTLIVRSNTAANRSPSYIPLTQWTMPCPLPTRATLARL